MQGRNGPCISRWLAFERHCILYDLAGLLRRIYSIDDAEDGIEQRVSDIRRKTAERLLRARPVIVELLDHLAEHGVLRFIDLAIVLYLAFFLLRDGERIRQLLIRALPFGDHREELLFARFALMLRATVRGTLLVAVAQGALGGIIFAVLGLRAPVLWGVIMTLLSLIPVVGAAVVWLPAAIYLLLTGEVVSGVVLMVYGVCVIGLADNALRPILVGRDTKLPDFMVLLSTLGGFALFGLDGFITGPVLAVLFVTLWQIFMEEFSSGEAAAPAASDVEDGGAAGGRPAD